jgi:hypothetical protein
MHAITRRDLYTLDDMATTKVARKHCLLPATPGVPERVDRINAATVQVWLAQLAEVSRDHRRH